MRARVQKRNQDLEGRERRQQESPQSPNIKIEVPCTKSEEQQEGGWGLSKEAVDNLEPKGDIDMGALTHTRRAAYALRTSRARWAAHALA